MSAEPTSEPGPLPPIVYHPAYSAELPSGHRFPMQKYARLIEVLREEGLIGPEGLWEPKPANHPLLSAVHDPDYVRQVLDPRVPPKVERVIGLPITRSVVERSKPPSAAR